jgi:enoyl-CoA hydratase
MALRVERDGPVTTVILDRPDVRNAVNQDTQRELAEAFRAFDADPEARVAVLWGDNGNFCAGADLKAVAAGKPVICLEEGDAPLGCTRMKLSKPVIAALSGYAVAGGFELAIWADLRVMEEDATMGIFCRRWGIPLIDGGTVRLPRLIGLSRAMDLILTGRAVDADEALSMGLVNRVVPQGTSRQAAEELAHQLAAFPQNCLKGDRRATLEQFDLSFDEAMKNEFRIGLESLATESIRGAQKFANGAGRHGSFDDSSP